MDKYLAATCRSAALLWILVAISFADASRRTRRSRSATGDRSETTGRVCPDPGIPEHGFRYDTVFSPGQSVRYGCNPGYRLAGADALTCRYRSRDEVYWDADTPQCMPRPTKNASDPCGPQPEATRFAFQSSYTVGVSVSYQCIGGHVPRSGNAVLNCTNGEWQGVPLRCRRLGRCTDYGNLQNGYRTIQGTLEGDTVEFGCNERYILIGNRDVTCGRNGQWIGAWPQCGATVECGDPDTPNKGSRIIVGTTEGSTVDYSCQSGYVLRGDRRRTCLESGLWSGSLPSCNRVNCGRPSRPRYGSVTFTSTLHGAEATYECNDGYVMMGSSRAVCRANGEWSRDPPTCRAVYCGSLRNPTFGRVRVRETTFGSTASYHCRSGYGLVGTPTRVCRASGRWSGSAPSCRSDICGNLQDPSNGRVTYTSMTMDSVATYSCDFGYIMSGSRLRRCRPSGWSGLEPICDPVRCPEINPPPHGAIAMTNENTVYSIVTYTCDTGYYILGGLHVLRRCQPNGVWTGFPPGCYEINCGSLRDPHHGSAIFTSTTFGSETYYECDPGYQLMYGDRIRTCTNNSIWSGAEPCCIPVMCPRLENPENGRVDSSRRRPGDIATYSCSTGYILDGEMSRICLQDGTWDGTQPTCIRVCPTLEDPGNGTVDQTGIFIGSVANYSCSERFMIASGDSVRTCQENGSWSGSDPQCIFGGGASPMCEVPEDPDNGAVTFNSTEINSVAVYSCDLGYILQGSANRTCQQNPDDSVTRSGSAPTCEIRNCGDLDDPTNGEVQLTTTTFGSNATYICNADYNLNGTEVRMCEANGMWSGNAPTCELIQCEELTSPANGSLTLTNENFIRSTAFYCCNEGFEPIGTSIRTCTNIGWTGEEPTCEPLVDCGDLQSPANGQVIFTTTTTDSIARYNCSEPFNISGPDTRVCQSNGMWTGREPTCERPVLCPNLSNPDNGMVSMDGNTPGSNATYTCNSTSGFCLMGNATRECSSTGEWVPSIEPTCINECPELILDNGMIFLQTGRRVDSEATFICNDEFTRCGLLTISCRDSCTWSDEPPICKRPVLCPNLSNPDNGMVSMDGNTPGSNATYTCNSTSGFCLMGNATRECSSTGEWVPSIEPTCINECPELILDNGMIFLQTGRHVDSEATFICNDGFTRCGLLTISCRDSCTWSDEPPICKRLCPNLPNPDNGLVSMNDNTPGSTATYTCNSGYRLMGNDTRTCSQLGEWTPAMAPTCERVQCPSLEAPVNGRIFVVSRNVDGMAFYNCNNGFTLDGLQSRQCEADGQWAGNVPTCTPNPETRSCPLLEDPQNGNVNLTTTTVGSVATYTCLEGYVFSGSEERQCQNDETWSNEEPTCDPVNCGSLMDPANGHVSLLGTTLGMHATYSCDVGHVLMGMEQRVCTVTGNWRGEAPTCISIDCGSLPNPLDGMVVLTGTVFNSQANYSCTTGYRPVGSQSRICGEMGEWSGEEPTCECLGSVCCGDPGTPDNGDRDLQSTTTGSRVEYTCNFGYTLVGDATRVCQNNQQWSRQLPQCFAANIMCPELSDPENGMVFVSRRSVGGTATYFCDSDFDIDGVIQRECMPDGQWSSAAPECLPAQCPSLPDPTNGMVTISGHEAGSIATYICNPGYNLRPPGQETRTCQPSGQWTGQAPVCERIECPNPGSPRNGRRTCDDFGAGSRVYFVCNDDYVIQGSSVLLCGDNGRWDNSTPTCTLADRSCSGSGELMDQFGRRCSCISGQLESCSRYRRDWNTLSDPQKEEYISTVITAATNPQYKPLYDKLAQAYLDSFETIAQSTRAESSHFFPWHRYFLLEYEDMLRLIDKQITIPYWDWSLLPMDPYASPVFDPGTGFGNASDNVTLCVTNGPFQESEFQVTPSVGGGCLERQYGNFTYPSRSLIEDIILVMPASDFEEFHRSLQLFIHLNVRCFVGGHMCSNNASNDPLYLLHLARVDLLLDRWQSQDSQRATVQYDGDTTPLASNMDDNLVVEDFSTNRNLPYSVSVLYSPLQPPLPDPTSSPGIPAPPLGGNSI